MTRNHADEFRIVSGHWSAEYARTVSPNRSMRVTEKTRRHKAIRALAEQLLAGLVWCG